MGEYLEAFLLGNAAILGNVCMLPLYPGLFVLLADRVESGASARSIRWMGVVVLADVITAMVDLGGLLYVLSRSPTCSACCCRSCTDSWPFSGCR